MAMSHLPELAGTLYVPDFIAQPNALLQHLLQQVAWDTRMQARLTASYGKAYNYSQMTYPEQAMLPALAELLPSIEQTVGFLPNNCLLNHYADGSARMGYHAEPNRGIGRRHWHRHRVFGFRTQHRVSQQCRPQH